ncbi:MAG: hypothetical protein LBE84_10825, partial [Planctomycetota bacterium]|nr:hypothetical protein [Planctomycetota bacterium]
ASPPSSRAASRIQEGLRWSDQVFPRLQFASFPGQESKILQNSMAIFTEVLPISPNFPVISPAGSPFSGTTKIGIF